MAICRLLQNSTMEPEDVSRITAAYEQTLRVLCVKDRDDPLTEMIAKKIIKSHKAAVYKTQGRYPHARSKNSESTKTARLAVLEPLILG